MITISPGHWKHTGSGASDVINEVVEARKVVNRVIQILRQNNVPVNHVEDNSSTNQRQNLNYLVSAHNRTNRTLDVSVHFNATSHSVEGKGCEVLYYDQFNLAKKMSANLAKAGELRDRGAKERRELAFLSGTNKPAVLLEICFVSSETDAKLYKKNFEAICMSIAKDLAIAVGKTIKEEDKGELTMSQYQELKGLITALQNENIQLKAELAKKLEKPKPRTVLPTHEESWNWLTQTGISNGVNPQDYVSREQLGTMLKRFDNNINK